MRKSVVIIAFLSAIFEATHTEMTISCREKRFKGKDSCDLKKIKLTFEKTIVKLSSNPKPSLKVLHIEKEIVNFLPDSLMKSFKNISVLFVTESELMKVDKNTFKNAQELE